MTGETKQKFQDIEDLLTHRPPFIFVDELLEVDEEKGVYKWQAKTISFNNNLSEKEILVKIQNDPKFEAISFKDYDAKKIKKVQDKIQTIKARSGGRGAQFGMMTTFEFDKEPINEYRSEMEFN